MHPQQGPPIQFFPTETREKCCAFNVGATTISGQVNIVLFCFGTAVAYMITVGQISQQADCPRRQNVVRTNLVATVSTMPWFGQHVRFVVHHGMAQKPFKLWH